MILAIILIPIVIMAIGFFLLGLEEDRDIWSSAWNNFKYRRQQKKREKHE